MCNEFVFKKTKVLNIINAILEDNGAKKIDKSVFSERIKNISIYRGTNVVLIKEPSEVSRLLIEDQFTGNKLFYIPTTQAFLPCMDNIFQPSYHSRYEFKREEILVIEGNANIGKQIISENGSKELIKNSSFSMSSPLIFIKTTNELTRFMITPSNNQTIYIFIPNNY